MHLLLLQYLLPHIEKVVMAVSLSLIQDLLLTHPVWSVI
jgi:hypothetical protein